ncbi:unnamed protein product [Rotaria socialis]|uniref:Uncharacterized protein n=1 Tax=Rotaria socialis TaxID=392032 RepID=A0A817YAL6_9BILA|nr:unnamed protein product [Rotaria socialis]CAF3211203.1 unnamed protein product [Rotaria socialis]CAF3379327.1 unnamed protein product [Rotaria socialis]CAF3684449.1 unnamed protein product [Rotaria socialis]CAF3755293.1 unnamed protein product [Rotaria socialis]
MDSPVVPIYYWSYWATVIYIAGMFGYLAIDTSNYLFEIFNDSLSYFVYAFLAILFVVDAALYTIDWYIYAVRSRNDKNEPIQYQAELVACIFQNLGSYCYLISALLTFNKSQYMGKILLFNLIGIFAYLIESGFIFLEWGISGRRKPSTNPKRGCVSQDVYMWAHILYTVANLIYLCATTLAYRFYVNLNDVNVRGVVILQILGDLVYLCDACLYYEGWLEDKQEYDRNTERQKLTVLNFINQLTTENFNVDLHTKDNK